MNFPKIIYGLLGAAFLLAGVYGLIVPSSLAPAIEPNLNSEPAIKLLTESLLHVGIELSAAIATLGILLLIGVRDRDFSTKLYYPILLFFLFLSGVHWLEFSRGNREIISPFINSIPLLLFLLLFLLRKTT